MSRFPKYLRLPKTIERIDTSRGTIFVNTASGAAVLTDDVGSDFFAALRLHQGDVVSSLAKLVQTQRTRNTQDIFSSVERLVAQIQYFDFLQSNITNPTFETIRKGLHVYITNKCNLICRHCYICGHPSNSNELTLSDLEPVFDSLSGHLHSINISGGEPLLADELWNVARKAQQVTNGNASLYSNGTLIDRADTAKRIADHFREVQISLDGATASIHDQVRGSGAFDLTLNGLSHLCASGVSELAVAICLHPGNIKDLHYSLVPLLDSIDPDGMIKSVRFSRLLEIGRGAQFNQRGVTQDKNDSEKLVLLQESLLRSGRRIWADWEETPLSSRQDKSLTCGIGQSLCIDAKARVYACAVPRDDFLLHDYCNGNVDILSLQRSVFERFRADRQQPCNSCPLMLSCRGGCRLRSDFGNAATLTCCDTFFRKKAEKLAAMLSFYTSKAYVEYYTLE